MRMRILALISIICISISSHAFCIGKLVGNSGGNEREVAAYSASKGLAGWTVTGPDGVYELPLEPGDYIVSCGGRLVPYVHIRDNENTVVNHADDPGIDIVSEMWTPACKSFGQTFTANGTTFNGMGFWMPQGSAKMKISLREGGPDGKLIGENTTSENCDWITGAGMDKAKCPTTPGKVYYAELSSVDGIKWAIAMPKGPNAYSGGIAYFDGVAHPESDLAVSVWETRPGLVAIAAAQADQHFIKDGPGSGSCKTAGQSFVAKNGKNILTLSANCGFGGGTADFLFSIHEGGPAGKIVISKTARMVSDWGTTVYMLPNEVQLTAGANYFFEYKRVDGQSFYSYLSADVYPDGKAYRDGKEVEGNFDQMFDISGEVEPGGITFPYNIKASELTSDSVKITWETGTPADGIIYYGDSTDILNKLTVNADNQTQHSVELTNLKPATVYYYRTTSFTGKQGAGRAWGHMESFMTLPSGIDQPRYDKPEPINPVANPGAKNVTVINGSFEEGFKGWSRCSEAKPKESKDYPIGNGPFGSATPGTDGYKPHAGKMMYGWSHLAADDPNPTVPREDWKQEVISQKIKVQPGYKYILKAWVITGDRGSGWGRDSRVRLAVDSKNLGLLEKIDSAAQATATQWFALENEWKPISLHFTAESDTVEIGVHFLQWWAMDADYLYADDVSVEEVE